MIADDDMRPGINAAVDRLMRELVTLQDELRRREASIGTGNDPRRINRLREQIRRAEARLERAERLQDGLR